MVTREFYKLLPAYGVPEMQVCWGIREGQNADIPLKLICYVRTAVQSYHLETCKSYETIIN